VEAKDAYSELKETLRQMRCILSEPPSQRNYRQDEMLQLINRAEAQLDQIPFEDLLRERQRRTLSE
jgi:hypothetical protein